MNLSDPNTLKKTLCCVGAVGLILVAIYQLLTGDAADAMRSVSIAASLFGLHLNQVAAPPVATPVVVVPPTVASRPDLPPPSSN